VNIKEKWDLEKYHQGELAIARDPTHPNYIQPPPISPRERILDIGCGAGQTLLSSYADRVAIGLDVDPCALALGRRWSPATRLVNASAEQLPVADASMDLVVARVSLPYTDLRKSLPEVRRVLRPGGRFWATLHPIDICLRQARNGNYKSWIYFAYIACNSLLFHFTQRTFRLRGRMESFQTEAGFATALLNAGFENIRFERGKHFVVSAELKRETQTLVRDAVA
jgi:ubiquinone/menaquinone biosynthesis C-methylase UbiE